jgi:hypothetical protein
MLTSARMGSRRQTLVQLTAEVVEKLDRRAAELGISRSRLIRDLLERGLAEESEEELSRRMVDGYRRMPQSEGRDAWGDLEAWVEVAGRGNLAAVTQDEEEAW